MAKFVYNDHARWFIALEKVKCLIKGRLFTNNFLNHPSSQKFLSEFIGLIKNRIKLFPPSHGLFGRSVVLKKGKQTEVRSELEPSVAGPSSFL